MTWPAGVCWWLANLLAELLDEDEREIIRGDLLESGVGGANALQEILGLVIRRQAAAWLDWRPWLVAVSVALPIGLLLSHASRWWAVSAASNIATYWSLWDFAYLGNPGWRQDLMRFVAGTLVMWLALIGWSWTTGFILGRLSRQTTFVTFVLFALVVFIGTLGTAPTGQTRSPEQIIVASSLLRTFLVILPAVLGSLRGARRSQLPLVPVVLLVMSLVVLTSMAARGLEGSVVFGRGTIPMDPGPDGYVISADDPRPWWPLSLIVLAPSGYIIASSAWQRWTPKGTTARSS